MNQRRVLKLQKRIAQLSLARREIHLWIGLFRARRSYQRIDPDALARMDDDVRQVTNSIRRLRKLLSLQGAKPAMGALAKTLAHHADAPLMKGGAA